MGIQSARTNWSEVKSLKMQIMWMSHLNTNHFAVQIHSHWSALLNDVNMDYDSPKFMG